MQFSKLLTQAITAILLLTPSLTSASPTKCNKMVTTDEWHDHLISNYLGMWAGNISLLNETMSPNITLYQDRFPTGNGSAYFPVFNQTEFVTFWTISRGDFSSYQFIDDLHFGKGLNIALRWTLNATYAGTNKAPLPAGSHVAYSGTDVITLNPCTGLVDLVRSSQDLITLYHNLGITNINI